MTGGEDAVNGIKSVVELPAVHDASDSAGSAARAAEADDRDDASLALMEASAAVVPAFAAGGQGLGWTPQSWMGKAACGGHPDPDLWFPERGEHQREQEALRICAACPVRAACLAYVLSMPPQPGIWGSTTEHQRSQDRRRRAAQCGKAS